MVIVKVATPLFPPVHAAVAFNEGTLESGVEVLVGVAVFSGVLVGVKVAVFSGVLVGVAVGRLAQKPVTLRVTEERNDVLYVTVIVA